MGFIFEGWVVISEGFNLTLSFWRVRYINLGKGVMCVDPEAELPRQLQGPVAEIGMRPDMKGSWPR